MTQRRKPPRDRRVVRAYLALCARCGRVLLRRRDETGVEVVCNNCARQRPLSANCE